MLLHCDDGWASGRVKSHMKLHIDKSYLSPEQLNDPHKIYW